MATSFQHAHQLRAHNRFRWHLPLALCPGNVSWPLGTRPLAGSTALRQRLTYTRGPLRVWRRSLLLTWDVGYSGR